MLRMLRLELGRVLASSLVVALTLGAGPAPAGDPAPSPAEPLWVIPVLVISYFPLTADGARLDSSVTGNTDLALAAIREKVERLTRGTIDALEEGSRFRAYANANARPSLRYRIVDTLEVLEPMPASAKRSGDARLPDYQAVLTRAAVRHHVEELGVKEVWLWGYHSSELALWESNLSTPWGEDVSNSDRDPSDLPILTRTYTVYHYNYDREVNEAVHDHLHQIEALMRHHGGALWQTFEGTPGAWRCGNCHFPPNGRFDYDWQNPEAVLSDIEDWRPDGAGEWRPVSCDRWGGDSLRWYVYWMRSIPGAENGLVSAGKPLTNWWIFVGDYDLARSLEVGLVER